MDTTLPDTKYVDDTTMYEILEQPTEKELKEGMQPPVSKLQKAADSVVIWTEINNMCLKKTFELYVCFSKSVTIPEIPNRVLNLSMRIL